MYDIALANHGTEGLLISSQGLAGPSDPHLKKCIWPLACPEVSEVLEVLGSLTQEHQHGCGLRHAAAWEARVVAGQLVLVQHNHASKSS